MVKFFFKSAKAETRTKINYSSINLKFDLVTYIDFIPIRIGETRLLISDNIDIELETIAAYISNINVGFIAIY